MFQPSRPQVYGGGQVINAPQQQGGGGGLFGDILNLATGLGLGIGTGNWAPLIGGVAGPQAAGLYTGATTGDWGPLGNSTMKGSQGTGKGETGQPKPTSTNSNPGQDTTDQTTDEELQPLLASEQMMPGLGQPLNTTQPAPQQMAAAPTHFMDPMRWFNG